VLAVAGGGAESISDAACVRAPVHEEQGDVAEADLQPLRQPATAYPPLPVSALDVSSTPPSHRLFKRLLLYAALQCV
jgi:hypothetical protein